MKDFFLVWLLPIICGIAAAALIWCLISYASFRAKGQRLKRRFDTLCRGCNWRLEGLSYETVRRVCGQPSSASPVGSGCRQCIWQEGGFGFSLLFDESEICVGVCDIGR